MALGLNLFQEYDSHILAELLLKQGCCADTMEFGAGLFSTKWFGAQRIRSRVPNCLTGQVPKRRPTGQSRREEGTGLD